MSYEKHGEQKTNKYYIYNQLYTVYINLNFGTNYGDQRSSPVYS